MQNVGTRLTRRPKRVLVCGLAAAGLTLFAAPAVRADNLQQVFQEYQSTGSINACQHSSGALGGGVGNDLEQYATDFVDALRAAQAAKGRCGGTASTSGGDSSSTAVAAAGVAKRPPGPRGGGKTRGGGSAGLIGTGAAPPLPAAPASLKSVRDNGTPGPILILAILAALTLLIGLPILIARYLGYGFDRLAPLRHIFGEGALRISTAGGGLADWLRLDALRRTA
jgi:hypothetical protein